MGSRLFSKSIQLVLSSLAFLASAGALAATPPAEFVGSYRLKAAVVGYCFEELRVTMGTVDPSDNDMRVGAYFFPKVNSGTWTYDIGFENGESTSWTTDDRQLIHEAKYFDQLRDLPGRRRYSARLLEGDLLRVRAEERGYTNSDAECLYQRVLEVPEEP